MTPGGAGRVKMRPSHLSSHSKFKAHALPPKLTSAAHVDLSVRAWEQFVSHACFIYFSWGNVIRMVKSAERASSFPFFVSSPFHLVSAFRALSFTFAVFSSATFPFIAVLCSFPAHCLLWLEHNQKSTRIYAAARLKIAFFEGVRCVMYITLAGARIFQVHHRQFLIHQHEEYAKIVRSEIQIRNFVI